MYSGILDCITKTGIRDSTPKKYFESRERKYPKFPALVSNHSLKSWPLVPSNLALVRSNLALVPLNYFKL